MKRLLLIIAGLLVVSAAAFAQQDKRDVRAGNRKFRKDKFKESEIDYRKALLKDSTSVPAAYNLGSALYKEQNYDEAMKAMESVKEQASLTADASKYNFNAGDVALQKKDYQSAVNYFRESLLRDPSDMDAKENYIYAKMMLQNQQNQQNQDQQNQDQNKDQNKDQDKDQDKKDQQDQNKDKNKQNKQDKQDQPQGQQPQEQNISPQQAQQMLKAIQAREKETQDKVNKEKAAALGSRQREKNW